LFQLVHPGRIWNLVLGQANLCDPFAVSFPSLVIVPRTDFLQLVRPLSQKVTAPHQL
jgi:hypothetical protein